MNLLISNMGQQITNASLWAIFAAYGKVDAAEIMFDEISGRSRGVGYVKMAFGNEALLALQKINGSIIDGKVMVVESGCPVAMAGAPKGSNRGPHA
jgi:RNA recognition motif-containing protein